MSNVKKILTYMEQHEEQFLKVLQHAVELESPTYGAKEITDRCGCYFQKLFRELGMQIHRRKSGIILQQRQREPENHFWYCVTMIPYSRRERFRRCPFSKKETNCMAPVSMI